MSQNTESTVSVYLSQKLVRMHILAAIFLVVIIFWFKPFGPASQLYFWVPFVLGILAAAHYFAYRTVHVTDDWVEERAGDLRTRSYDFDHIENITERHSAGHPTANSPEAMPESDRAGTKTSQHSNRNSDDDSRGQGSKS